MIRSMTGFAGREMKIAPYGKICVELRSANHKFQETVLHLPEGFLSLEEEIKKIIETKIKRGRVTCAINVVGGGSPGVFINKKLLRNYMSAIGEIKKQFNIHSDCSMDTLVHLPGVLSLAGHQPSKAWLATKLNILLAKAAGTLLNSRKKEGEALYRYFKARIEALGQDMQTIKRRFKKALKNKKADLIGFVDGDMATTPEAFYELVKNIDDYDKQLESADKKTDEEKKEMQKSGKYENYGTRKNQ